MPRSSVNWNSVTRRYERNGKAVSPDVLRKWITKAVMESRERLKGYAEAYQSGRTNQAQFFVSLNEEIKRSHTVMGVVAHGGKDSMDAKSWGRVGQRIAEQRKYARTFAAEMLEVDAKDFPAWRAESYANVYPHTFENMILARETGRKVQRFLGPSEQHCTTCPPKAKIWDADKAPPLGDDDCGPGCNCFYQEVSEVAA